MKYMQPITIVILTVALLLSVQRCNYIAGNAEANYSALTDTVTHYKNKLGTVTASMGTLQLDNNQVKDLLLKKDSELAALASEFAKLHSVVKYDTDITLPPVSIPFKDSVPCVFSRTDSVKHKWYSFTYDVDQKGLKIDSLIIPNTATVITGTKRKWFLGKETVTTDITNTNPYVKVTGITAAEVVLPVPWYKKWYVWLAAGVVGGFVLSK